MSKIAAILYTVPMKKMIVFLMCILFLLASLCCARLPYDAKTMDVTVFSIGKADAVLISYDGYHVLIDAGEQDDGADLVSELSARNIEKLDLFLVTHFDKDHIGGADTLISNIPVDRMIVPNYVVDTKQYRQMQTAMAAQGLSAEVLREDITFSIGDATYIIWVSTVEYDDNDNEQSLITKVLYDGSSLLFMGDAEEDWLKSLTFSGRNLTCDVMKLPHHGVYDENLEALFLLALPSHVLITDSEKNPMDEETENVLRFFETDYRGTKDGDILLRIRAGNISFVE